jgi:serine/threonine protein kinase
MGQICPFCGSSIPPGSSFCPTCGTPLVLTALPVGTKLKGRYSVGKVLGQGGFGITYKGGDSKLLRPIAIKELFPEGCIRNQKTVQPTHPDVQREFIHIKQRFIEEARLLARLNHPGIVKVYDFFEENNTAYMIMELLKGKSLRKLIEERGRIDEDEALDYIIKLCEALSIVHKNGYLHRDIKPDNIFITDEGRVVLIDFGSAREFIAGRTKTHTVILTQGYAPPEQYSLVAQRGAYTDIYALAATLYHMLTGEVPADAPARQAGMKLRSPREINPKVSQKVSDAVMAGLEMDYRKRPQNIEDFLALFKIKRNPVVVNSPPAKFSPYQIFHSLKGHSDFVFSVAFSPDGKMLASGSLDKTIKLWGARDGVILQTLKGHGAWVRSVAFSPDGKLIASGSGDNTIKIWRVTDGNLLHTLENHKGGIWSVAFSPDGNIIASGSWDATIMLWRAGDGGLVRTLRGHNLAVWCVAFSPDGKLLASASWDYTIKIWRVRDGLLLRTLEGHKGGVWSVVFSPDGELIASGGDDYAVKIWRVRDGALQHTLKAHSAGVRAISFAPEGDLIASGSIDETVNIWRIKDGALLQTLRSHIGGVYSVSFSPDGELIAIGGQSSTVKIFRRGD